VALAIPGRIVAILGLTLLTGCRARLTQPITCEQMLGLRIGQTTADVRAVLGEPREIDPDDEAVPLSGRDANLRGVRWDYSSADATNELLLRDLLRVRFYDDRLTWVSAFRKLPFERDSSPVFWLMRDPRYPDRAEERMHDDMVFTSVFPCAGR
jgi:hypothetical protein